jgi:peptide/nickel transport system substrate-binding protein
MNSPKAFRRYFTLGLAAAALALAAACGSEDAAPATAVPTVAPKPTLAPATARPADPAPTRAPDPTRAPQAPAATSTPAAALPTATATAVPSAPKNLAQPKSPAGTITIAVADIVSHPGINRSQGGESSVFWGAGETLFTTKSGPVFGEPWLAKSWTMASDLSKVTIQLQQGVQFHQGYGEMTAEDVAWSINDASARTNPQSIHAQAGDLAPVFLEWKAIDKYTVDAPFALFDPRWQSNAISDGWQPTGIFSKKVFDTKGLDWMKLNTVMTGPFEVTEWTQDKRAALKAVKGHWRKSPVFESLIYLDIPEAAVRLAMIKTGEADVSDVVLKDIPALLKDGYGLAGTSNGSELNMPFAGNLWEKTHAKSGETLTREGLDLSKPWIGNPDDAASMEKARKVRWALAMAYDREELNEVLAAGLGWPHGIGFINPRMPQYQAKWDVPYDPDRAKKLLAEAGYPNGFKIELYGQSNTQIRQEMADAVGGFWSQRLGLDVSVVSYHYNNWRPLIVARQAKSPHVNSCDDGRFPRPWDWPIGPTLTSLTRGGFSCAAESPYIAQQWLKGSVEPDIQKRSAINSEVADYLHNWMIMPGTITIPVVVVYNPNSIKEWNMRPSLSGPISSPELIVPAR